MIDIGCGPAQRCAAFQRSSTWDRHQPRLYCFCQADVRRRGDLYNWRHLIASGRLAISKRRHRDRNRRVTPPGRPRCGALYSVRLRRAQGGRPICFSRSMLDPEPRCDFEVYHVYRPRPKYSNGATIPSARRRKLLKGPYMGRYEADAHPIRHCRS